MATTVVNGEQVATARIAKVEAEAKKVAAPQAQAAPKEEFGKHRLRDFDGVSSENLKARYGDASDAAFKFRLSGLILYAAGAATFIASWIAAAVLVGAGTLWAGIGELAARDAGKVKKELNRRGESP